MKTQAIIPAAGKGTRLKAAQSRAGALPPKPLIPLYGKPLFVYALEAFERCSLIDSVIVVADKDNLAEFKKIAKRYRLSKVKKIIAGGKERFNSVANGLKALDPDTDFVVIHDGARPLVTPKLISDAVTLCFKEKAVVVAVPAKPTIKRVDPKNLRVQETLSRDTLWETQTPQVFEKKLLVRAHQANECCNPTDDAMMVEALGVKVKVLKGDYRNLKITTADDLVVAEALLNVSRS